MDFINGLSELFGNLEKTPVPAVLVIAGLIFLLLSMAGKLAGQIEIPESRQTIAGAIGIVLLCSGIFLYVLPEIGNLSPSVTVTPMPSTTNDLTSSTSTSIPQPSETINPIATETSVPTIATSAPIVLIITATPETLIPTETPITTSTPLPEPTIQPTAKLLIAQSIELGKTDWFGGYDNNGIPYGARDAVWIYGKSSKFSSIQSCFALENKPEGEAEFIVEGMDAEGTEKSRISIQINGIEIFNGISPLNDALNKTSQDEMFYTNDNWSSSSWKFDSSILRIGENKIIINKLDFGNQYDQSWFMLRGRI